MLRIGNNKWVAGGLRPRPWPWLTVTASYPTDEGFYSCETYYQLQGLHLECHQNTRARDCDGRVDYHWHGRATGLRLRVWRNNHWQPVSWRNRPHLAVGLRWREMDSSQRDHSAEAMGY